MSLTVLPPGCGPYIILFLFCASSAAASSRGHHRWLALYLSIYTIVLSWGSVIFTPLLLDTFIIFSFFRRNWQWLSVSQSNSSSLARLPFNSERLCAKPLFVFYTLPSCARTCKQTLMWILLKEHEERWLHNKLCFTLHRRDLVFQDTLIQIRILHRGGK